MAGDRQICKILEFGRGWAVNLGEMCRAGDRIADQRAIDLEEPDINQCDVAIVSLQEVRSLDRD
ncbi:MULTISPECIES: hypothetical protein [unclassified Microcoleus]|uniref:hypothetical protein n=1 Tax=unclassified Microcoleus TaxID=2642155 RepID=UPI002FD55E4E